MALYYIEVPDYLVLILAIITLIITIYFVWFMIYINKKIKQTKEEFYAKTKLFKTFSIISLFFSTGIGILLIFVAYTKDDTSSKKILVKYDKKPVKPIIILTKESKKQIRQLKSQKRRGIISNENYQKKYNQIIKQQKQLD